MKLNILSPTQSKSFDVKWIEVQTDKGNFIIQQGHAPIIVTITQNKELVLGLADGSTTVMNIMGGILEVKRDAILLLLTHD